MIFYICFYRKKQNNKQFINSTNCGTLQKKKKKQKKEKEKNSIILQHLEL